ncbi:MAG: formylglycine-generating enzyme family protein [Verrucomicrobia bacterium]|nr:formylglycine-generating enzyme family protein [Verrucomicrobiota bacterium]
MNMCHRTPIETPAIAPHMRLVERSSSLRQLAAGLIALLGIGGFDLSFGAEISKGRRIETDAGIVLIEIPGGEFLMGGDPNHPLRDPDDPNPVRVKLSRYWISETEVSYKQYAKVRGILTTGGHAVPSNPWPSDWPPVAKADLPVENIDYYTLKSFFLLLTQRVLNDGHFKTGRAVLPSEAQWEYAARAGKQTPLTIVGLAEYLKSCNENIATGEDAGVLASARVVGMGAPNGFGLRDMLGNVSELCRDVYQRNLKGGLDPVVLETDNIETVFVVIRGGGCGWSNPEDGRFECRSSIEPYRGTGRLGFRVVWIGEEDSDTCARPH